MNSKNIAKSLNAKLNNWLETIEDEQVKKVIKENAIVTGGALVSLLQNEEPNDYDIYFKTFDSCMKVSMYYANKWNNTHDTTFVEVKEEDGRVVLFLKSVGAVFEEDDDFFDYEAEALTEQNLSEEDLVKPKYRPVYLSTNAISLSDGIQIVIRFYGDIDTIHQNYDFTHCTCSYDYATHKVNLPTKALECIINKELHYQGSKYPLCSIIRTRKFISRGWTINAGQYAKMAIQLNELNLKDINVFKDQLVGVDSAYFNQFIRSITGHKEKNPDFDMNTGYLCNLIDIIF